jgi:catechol 2,3-dioxygenase-like lactoylglutathione lyase family enzyme
MELSHSASRRRFPLGGPSWIGDMITSIHTLIYSDDANATRAFLRDVLGWKDVAEDFDNDWLIFKSGSSEMGGRGPIEQCEYGRVIMMIVPGADDIQLYQPTHKLAYNL